MRSENEEANVKTGTAALMLSEEGITELIVTVLLPMKNL